MSIIYREICNGCGLWNEANRASFNRIELDLTNYVLFSCAFRLREPKTEILFCNSCYSKIMDSDIVCKTGEEIERLRRLLEKKDEEISEIKRNVNSYHADVKRALEGIEIK